MRYFYDVHKFFNLYDQCALQLVPMDLEKQTFSMVSEHVPVFGYIVLFVNYDFVGMKITLSFLFGISFVAIRFVLSDLFHNLRSEDRHALLHVCFTTYLFIFK